MKVFKYVVLATFLISIACISLKLVINYFFFNYDWERTSYSVNESRQQGQLAARYRLARKEDHLEDSLKKYGYPVTIFDTTQFWIEHAKITSLKYLFFYPQRYSAYRYFLYQDPLLGNCDAMKRNLDEIDKGRKPEIAFLLPDQDPDTGGSVSSLHMVVYQDPYITPDGIVLQVYFYWHKNHEKHAYPIGKVELKRVEYREVSTSSIQNSLWSSFYFFLPSSQKRQPCII